MRSIKLTVAVVAAATSLPLASAAASARGIHEHRAHSHGSGCHATLSVAPRLVTSGESVLAFGRLSCANEAEDVNQTVTLYESSVTSPGFSVAGTSTTEEHGFYKVTASDLTTNSVFYATVGAAQSGHRNVKVAAQVSLSGPPEGVVPTALHTGHHNMVTFTGDVSPADAGALVILQRQNAIRGNEWHRIGHGVPVSKAGEFTITHTFRYAGDANIRVVVRSGDRNAPSPSNVLGYEIVQAQNPQLTIESSANPISYGQSVTIKGVVAAAADTPVQLLARTAQQSSFTPVGEVKTDSSGDYTFPAQTPLKSTFYKVKGAGKNSAVLYEGVKFVLTAGVSDTTVQSGQALTFSGTVTPSGSVMPGETGHVVYLERENPGGSFHVIEEGTVTANSTYTITHTFYNVGASVMRIKIPGGPLNGTTDSTPFTITTTVAPAASLTPEAPGNSTLPPEGQV
jgi:hypothetical protein